MQPTAIFAGSAGEGRIIYVPDNSDSACAERSQFSDTEIYQKGTFQTNFEECPLGFVEDATKINGITAGYSNTIFVYDNKVYAIGDNTECQICYFPEEEIGIDTPTQDNESLKSRKMIFNKFLYVDFGGRSIKMAASGFDFTIYVDDQNKAFICGSQIEGFLEIPNDNVKIVAASYYYPGFIDSQGIAYTWEDYMVNGSVPKQIKPEKPKDKFFQMVCCTHFIVLLDIKHHAWGLKRLGSNGNLDMINIGKINKFKQISGCYNHVVFRTGKKGPVFAYGNNDYGQLGIGSTDSNFSNLIEIKGIENVVQVATCCYSTLFLVKNKNISNQDEYEIWGCGCNMHGELGCLNTDEKFLVPTKIESIKDNDIESITCGSYHTIFVKRAKNPFLELTAYREAFKDEIRKKRKMINNH